MTGLVIALLFALVGAVVHLALDGKASEIGRALLWVGVLLLGLALTGIRL